MIHSAKATMALAGQDQCKLRPYKDKCPKPLTPHHCVPDHCFRAPDRDGGGMYPGGVSHADGLCVCLSGATKSTAAAGGRIKKDDYPTEKKWFDALAEHGQVHSKFDKAESDLGAKGDPANSAKLGELEDAAAEAIGDVTGCDKADLKKQMREFHQKKGLGPDTKLRADPFGQRAAPPANLMGSNATAGGMPG